MQVAAQHLAVHAAQVGVEQHAPDPHVSRLPHRLGEALLELLAQEVEEEPGLAADLDAPVGQAVGVVVLHPQPGLLQRQRQAVPQHAVGASLGQAVGEERVEQPVGQRRVALVALGAGEDADLGALGLAGVLHVVGVDRHLEQLVPDGLLHLVGDDVVVVLQHVHLLRVIQAGGEGVADRQPLEVAHAGRRAPRQPVIVHHHPRQVDPVVAGQAQLPRHVVGHHVGAPVPLQHVGIPERAAGGQPLGGGRVEQIGGDAVAVVDRVDGHQPLDGRVGGGALGADGDELKRLGGVGAVGC